MALDFFIEIDHLYDEWESKLSRIHQHKTSFTKSFDDFISQHHRKELSWPELFNSRMMTYQNVLTTRSLEHYIHLVRAFVDIRTDSSQKKALKKKEHENLNTAKDLLQFLTSHRMDPDNSLLGLAPSQAILEKHCKRITDAFANVGVQTKQLAPSDLKAESLILRIMNWSELEDSEQIGNEVRQFAYQLLTNLQIGVGDVVLCKLQKRGGASSSIDDDADDAVANPDNASPILAAASALSQASSASTEENQSKNFEWLYCRVYRVLPNSVIVHNNPLEVKTMSVPNSNVIPLDASMKSKLGAARTMESLVEQPVDILYREIQETVSFTVNEYLLSININPQIIDSSMFHLKDLPELEDSLARMQLSFGEHSSDLLKNLEALTSVAVKEFISKLNPLKVFSPMREQIFRSLRNLPVRELSESRFKFITESARTTVDLLHIQRRQHLDGTKKRALTEWYLYHIESSVDAWLKERGFDFDAIPQNYLEHPPRGGHLHTVRDNLEIIEKVKEMDNGNNLSPLEMMGKLRVEVYEQIDEFVNNLFVILSQIFKDVVVDETSLNSLHAGITDGTIPYNPSDPREEAWVKECLKDLEYIIEMRSQEEITFTKKKIALSKVVPITGLIFSRFLRIENELRTVLDVWSHLDRMPQGEAQSGFNTMHSAYGLRSVPPVSASSVSGSSSANNQGESKSDSKSDSKPDIGSDDKKDDSGSQTPMGRASGFINMIKSKTIDRKSTVLGVKHPSASLSSIPRKSRPSSLLTDELPVRAAPSPDPTPLTVEIERDPEPNDQDLASLPPPSRDSDDPPSVPSYSQLCPASEPAPIVSGLRTSHSELDPISPSSGVAPAPLVVGFRRAPPRKASQSSSSSPSLLARSPEDPPPPVRPRPLPATPNTPPPLPSTPPPSVPRFPSFGGTEPVALATSVHVPTREHSPSIKD